MSFKNIALYLTLGVLVFLWFYSNQKAVPQQVIEETQVDRSVEETTFKHTTYSIALESPNTATVQEYCPFPLDSDLEQGQMRLNLKSQIDTGTLKRDIIISTRDLLSRYKSWLEVDTLPGVDVELLVLPELQFNSFMTGRVADPSNYLGAFLPNSNLAVVKFINKQQALATAIHEITHVINHALFGPLPRFVNEGLAEYTENFATKSRSSRTFKLPEGVEFEALKDELLDFYALMYSEHDWHTTNNSSLYLSGSAWAHFLMNSELGLKAIKSLLQQKYLSPCVELSKDSIIDVLAEEYPNFEQDFGYWFEEKQP